MSASCLCIIVSYNGMTWLPQCLAALHESKEPIDVCVVDNCSTDSTVEFVKNDHPSVILITQGQNLGFGGANNVGLSYALQHHYEFVFLLNQDVYVNKNTIGNLIALSRNNPQFGILSPVHLDGNGETFDFGFARHARRLNGFCADLYRGKIADIYDTKFVNAAAWLITSQCLKRVGGFSPLFFQYGEDANYAQRVLYHGLKIGVCPSTTIRHDRNDYGSQFDGIQQSFLIKGAQPAVNRRGFLFFKLAGRCFIYLAEGRLKDFISSFKALGRLIQKLHLINRSRLADSTYLNV